MKSSNPRGISARVFIGIAAAALAISSLVPTVSSAQEKAAATELEKVEVTGSRIKRIDIEGPTPVTVIGRDQIEKSGYVSVQDILNDLTSNTGGTVDQSFTFGFTPGAAGVDIRGFGAGRTLVLLDGRRLPAYPIGLSGTDSFVDLSTIPTVLIERIEVLTDGASAIYGSDAISAVVNIITRKNVQGSFVSGRLGGTEHGGLSNQRYQAVMGVTTPESSLSVFGEYSHNAALGISQRSYSESDFTGGGNGSGFGSTFFGFDGQVIPDPDCGTPADALGGLGVPTASGICRFDRTPFRQYFPEIRQGSATLQYDRKLGSVDSYSRMTYFESKTNSQSEPNAYSGGEGFDPVNPGAQAIPFTVHNFGTVFAGAPNNPTNGTFDDNGTPNDPNDDVSLETDGFFQRRLIEFGPRRTDIDTNEVRLLTGLKGMIGAYNWDVGISMNRKQVTIISPNIISSLLDNEVSNNGLDLLQPIPADVVARMKFTSVQETESRNTLVDATFTGPIPLRLPGGDIQFSVHADGQYEKYFDISDPISSNGDVFDGGSSGGGDRKYFALGTEFVLPLLDQLELDLAGRFDKYVDDSDVGGAFSPRVALQYRPFEFLYFRASAGQSFRAPDLQRLFGGATKAFDSAVDSPRCVALGGVPNETESIPSCVEPVQSIALRVTSNPNLKEEEGENFNVGFGWEIIKDLTLKADYYYVKLENIVTDPSTQSILDSCAEEGIFCDQIDRGADVDTNGDGQVLDELGSVIKLGAKNLSKQDIKGIDGSLSYRFTAGPVGKFTAEYNVSWVQSLKLQLTPEDDADEQIDFASIPEYRMGAHLDWSLSDFGAFLRADYVGDYPGAFSNGPNPPKDEYFSSFTTWDAQFRYAAGKWGTVRLGIDNIFDRDMPLDPTAQGGNRPNQFIDSTQTVYHNAVGRAGYIQYELAF